MRPSYALWLLGMSMAGSGCALVEDGTRNVCLAISTPIEIHREKARNEKWAEAAWQNVCMKDGPTTHAADFARGFKDGFAEYLFRGGNSEPPLVAPLRYRHIRYQTGHGYQAIQDWFAGFRTGASAARDSGARRWITGPSSLLVELPAPDNQPWIASPPQPPQEELTSEQKPVSPARVEFLPGWHKVPPIAALPPEPHEAPAHEQVPMRQSRQPVHEASAANPARPAKLDFRGEASPIVTLPTEPREAPQHEVIRGPLLWELPRETSQPSSAAPAEVEFRSPRVNVAPVVAMPIKEQQESINVRFRGTPLALPEPRESPITVTAGAPVAAPLHGIEEQVTPNPVRLQTRTR